MKKGEEEYLASDAYKKFKEERDKDAEEGKDKEYPETDPEGWTAYLQAAEGQDDVCFQWANTAVTQVVSNPMLSAKCL